MDAGMEYSPFIVSDGTADIYVNPTDESFSLNHEINTVTGSELLERVDEARLDLDPSAHTDSGLFNSPVELVEGTLGVGEKVHIVGKARTAPERRAAGADAVMTPKEGHLIVANDEPQSAALRTGARGLFLLVLGILLSGFGLVAFMTNVGSLIEILQVIGSV
jgi:hypothetical protein